MENVKYNPSIWSHELNDSRRSYLGSILMQGNAKTYHTVDLGKTIGILAQEPIPDEYTASHKAFHNTKYRRLLSEDITALNNDPKFPCVLISNGNGIKVCTKTEYERLYKVKRRGALRNLALCSVIARKAGRNGQITITEDGINTFVGGDMRNDEPICKQGKNDCKANKDGCCLALLNTEFRRKCPFYEKRKENEE